VLLLAGGVGITPLRTLFETLPGKPGDITLAYRVEREKDVLFRKELEEIAATRGHQVLILLGPPGGPNDPLSPQRLGSLIPGLANHDVFLCGPPGMARAAERSLEALRVPRANIHTEKFEF
jgi:ferredoxin-NADP reductase